MLIEYDISLKREGSFSRAEARRRCVAMGRAPFEAVGFFERAKAWGAWAEFTAQVEVVEAGWSCSSSPEFFVRLLAAAGEAAGAEAGQTPLHAQFPGRLIEGGFHMGRNDTVLWIAALDTQRGGNGGWANARLVVTEALVEGIPETRRFRAPILQEYRWCLAAQARRYARRRANVWAPCITASRR